MMNAVLNLATGNYSWITPLSFLGFFFCDEINKVIHGISSRSSSLFDIWDSQLLHSALFFDSSVQRQASIAESEDQILKENLQIKLYFI